MRIQAGWRVVLIVFALVLPASARLQEKEFQPDRRVRQPTRLDWEFVNRAETRLPGNYDSRKQRYQLFVPHNYSNKRAWPLILFLSPGDDPVGWRVWRAPCESAGFLFAAPFGVGRACPQAQRIRSVLDVWDDIRSMYRIDADRTYLVGLDAGATLACQIAFALPEHTAGVVAMGGEVPLPEMPYLRNKLKDRLSVALVSGKIGSSRLTHERYIAPLLRDLGIRSRVWLTDSPPRLAPVETLSEVAVWLEDDLKRRQTEAREAGLAIEDTPTRRELSTRALTVAQKHLGEADRLGRTAALLDWIVVRGGAAESAKQAGELLQHLRADAEKGRLVQQHEDAQKRTWLEAKAKALESLGDLDSARRAWEGVARLAKGAEQEKARAKARRLAGLLARSPYLGMRFAGSTLTIQSVVPNGPARRAGVQAGDTLERIDTITLTTPEQLREQLRRLRPGHELPLTIRRDGKVVRLVVRLGAMPGEE
jgi:pimeloyl-ACP methyl ester carboxylesterase